MSRIRTTLDTVTKAVGSTDLISKFSRLKTSSGFGSASHADKVVGQEESPASESVASGDMKPPEEDKGKVPEPPQQEREGKQQQQQEKHTAEKPFMTPKQVPSNVVANATSTGSSSSMVAKQTLQLFHPAALSANIEETYSSLSQHVNSYFGSKAPEDDGKRVPQRQDSPPAASLAVGPSLVQKMPGDHIPVLVPVAEAKAIESGSPPPTDPTSGQGSPESGVPTSEPPPADSNATVTPAPTTSPKKGISQYLSYPGPSVQAFVGSYFAPLVPKFRAETKSVTVEKEDLSPVDGDLAKKTREKAEKEEEKTAKDKAKQLLSQREKIIARVSVDNRTRALVKGLQRVTEVRLLTNRVAELGYHLLEFPETRGVAIKERVLPCLLRLRQARDSSLQAAVQQALALLGYTDPVRGRGIRVLAIDGGGTRGLVALQTLHKLQEMTGKPVHQLFDYICGVSTGAILAFMLGVYRYPLDECEALYRKLGSDVFKQNVIVGTVKMSWSHAFYNSETWEDILKERMGESLMVESARDPKCPKVSAVSTIVSRGLPLKAYVFRNYSLLPGVRSHYLGDCRHKMWQAIRASSAAPGYFQEFVLDKDLHQDGGLLINNPTALAIHECKLLWPNTPLQCVVSLGTGRYESAGKNNQTSTSLKAKITNVISSATDTEEVHTMLDALLPPDTYFRFNPYMTEDIPLDESRREKLDFLQSEGERYLIRNEDKLKKAASVLSQEKSAIQRLAEWAKLKADMYDGLPFSKL
ncbi:calcium-independent phospholipase A2-gamma [Osmerus mordax]|uniref:calcium-independent phospholipase A2-gamma n=1 Tax=Osmerus mordax TaxID=8014 RepID=UPI003510546F